MAAAELLATGSGAANSADQALTAGVGVSLKGSDLGSLIIVSLKDDAGGYNPVGNLTPGQKGMIIESTGTYRFTRPASSTACGVFSGG